MTGPKPRELLKATLKALQEGIDLQYAKPLLAAEVRRILPTAVGVPMELSLYTAAVAAASVNGMFFLRILYLSSDMRGSPLRMMLFHLSF